MYDELPLWSAPFGIKLLDYIVYKPNITAIDLGFGTGFPLLEIAMRLGNHSTVYGIEIWTEAFEKVKEKMNDYGITNVKLIEGNIGSIPLTNNSVNLITSNNCLNNVQNIKMALMECSRILNTDGQFIFAMNLDKTMFEFYDIMEETLAACNLKTEMKLMHKHIEQKRPSIDKILHQMKNDFIIKNIEYDQFNYKFTNGASLLNHHFIKIAFMDSWIKILPQNSVQKIFKIIETKLNQQAEKYGEIKLSIPFVLVNSYKK
jgi:ubiquinone/menaquinone biosynthesis C-methylase UbiE